MKELNPDHRKLGGTGVTNFPKELRPIYEQAVAQYGNPELIISDAPINDALGRTQPWMVDKYHSLHWTNEEGFDLSEFWRLFDEIKKSGLKKVLGEG